MPGFDDILGHDSIKQHMKKAIESRKISHAYILAGEAGMGKKSLARAFALTLMCEEGGSRPCLKCHACRQVLADSHPDLIWVSHEKPQTIGVDDVREQINDTILIRPYSGSHKIYFVDQAEKMTVQAQNALLKTIEEPPDYGIIFLLTANPDAFLPTILSRCVQLKLRPLSDSMVRDYLTKRFSVSEEDARLYAAFARGNLGKAARLAGSGEFRERYDGMVRLLTGVKSMDLSDMLDRIRQWKEEEADLEECLDLTEIWYRDALLLKAAGKEELLILREELPALREVSEATGYAGFQRIFQAIRKTRERLAANVNMELAMELLFLVMKEN